MEPGRFHGGCGITLAQATKEGLTPLDFLEQMMKGKGFDMIRLKLSEVFSCLEVDLPLDVDDGIIHGISTDTRSIREGDLFIALVGEKYDAHDFLDIAVQKNACALVVSKTCPTINLPQILVEDTLIAMQRLAVYCKKKLNIPIIAVTGSNGKTTTKDMIAHVLSTKYNVYSTHKNFNNQIGIPKSIFDIDESHEIAVLELGMNHLGEIEALSNIIHPDIAVITNIGTAHIGYLKTRENILTAKLEVVKGMASDATLLLNSDDDLLRDVVCDNVNICFVGSGTRGDELFKCANVHQTNLALHFIVSDSKQNYDCTIPMLGNHNATNALLAIACAHRMGVGVDASIAALRNYSVTSLRNEVSSVKGITIIKDYYNANPDSMRAALLTLEEYQTLGQKIAILGDMTELGEYADDGHIEMMKLCNELSIHPVYFVGEYFSRIKSSCSNHSMVFLRKEELIEQLKKDVKAKKLTLNDVVLIKASRSAKMEEVYENLKSFINAEYSDYVSLPPSPTKLYVDITAIKENYNSIRQALGEDVEIMPMVKANAYGCGAEIVANVLKNCKHLAVADVKEAAMLKRILPDVRFVIIYQPALCDMIEVLKNNYIPAISNTYFVTRLNEEAKKMDKVVKVHVEVDTGAGRLGIHINEVSSFFKKIKKLDNIEVDGIFMHYSCADSFEESDVEFTKRQTELFEQAVGEAEEVVGTIHYKHACSGAAIFNQKTAHFNMVRPGYMLYGYYPSPGLREKVTLTPSLTFVSVIIHIKECEEGTPISYSRTFHTRRRSRIATVSAGYSDGIMRKLSNKGYLVVNGQRAPIVGRVCMDLTMVDITDISGEVHIGDEVAIFDNVNVTVDEMAGICDTIGYEIIAGIEDKADRVEIP